jgi:hypothetical protein
MLQRLHMPFASLDSIPGHHHATDDYPSIGLQPWMSVPSGQWNRK